MMLPNMRRNLGRFTVDTHGNERRDGFYRAWKTGTKTAEVEVIIDCAKMKKYAEQALKNKSGKSTQLNGVLRFVTVPGTEQITKLQ